LFYASAAERPQRLLRDQQAPCWVWFLPFVLSWPPLLLNNLFTLFFERCCGSNILLSNGHIPRIIPCNYSLPFWPSCPVWPSRSCKVWVNFELLDSKCRFDAFSFLCSLIIRCASFFLRHAFSCFFCSKGESRCPFGLFLELPFYVPFFLKVTWFFKRRGPPRRFWCLHCAPLLIPFNVCRIRLLLAGSFLVLFRPKPLRRPAFNPPIVLWQPLLVAIFFCFLLFFSCVLAKHGGSPEIFFVFSPSPPAGYFVGPLS